MSHQLSSSLHPVLQAALKSLDVGLEVELARYRQHRVAHGLSPSISEDRQAELDETSATSGELAVTATPDNHELEFKPSDTGREVAHLAAAVPGTSLPEPTHSSVPEDFLESSEALLRNLQATKSPKKFNLSSRMLALCAAISIISLLGSLGLRDLLLEAHRPKQAKSSQTPPSTRASTPSVARNSHRTSNPAAISPDLSSEEFVKLAPNLSQLKPKPHKLQVSPKPTLVPGQTLPSAARTMEPRLTPAPTLPPTGSSPVQKQSSRSSAASTKASPLSGKGYYYVFINDTNDSVLKKVHQIAKDAYVRDLPEGKRVQVGAFNDRQSAQELVQALKRVGLTATIRQP